jgi:succinate dehydrogenase / fumarate reductase flavoprotein subunit
MGGIRVDATLQTRVPGLYACGEAVGGANGANRLSGNAITEAFVFGARAGRNAAQHAATRSLQWSETAARPALDLLRSAAKRDAPNPAAAVVQLQAVMANDVGPFRTDAKLRAAITAIGQLKENVGDTPLSSATAFDSVLLGWLDLRNALLVAQSVAVPALARTESRGAHQRDDHLGLDDEAWRVNQIVHLSHGAIHLRKVAPTTGKAVS